ncbi:hypothetical protein CHU92_07525 [Flavobacterium cyanobacteriorum]|uniref:Lipoprotein n=1 Tax=Flavobacterium cyanobacteriorum TaxID=2022802 RepID=A0A255ZAB3_9FLAO|nr:DUF6146 family protein [Flavobacterium cyanobacteriorum]OYQ37834.1 hypothetical protein CHU92_07525 [Flavobacterium cyanobacteriorum]
MKTYIFSFLTVLTLLLACNSQNKTVSASARSNTTATVNDTVRIANDELEYEIIIIDPGFNGWLASRARPRGYYSQQYFENKNRMWITEWNIRANQINYQALYQMPIDYQHHIDYGYEVNYLLYNYLVYFQQVNRQRLGGVVPMY